MASTPKPMVTRFKSARQKLNEQNIKTLAHLLQKPSITVTKTTSQKKLEVPSKKVVSLEQFQKIKPISPKGLKILGLTPETKILNEEVIPSRKRKRKQKKDKKQKKVVKKSEKIVKKFRPKSLTIESKEYYPNVPKRKTYMKKVMLKPKKSYKVVASMNKRKRRIPQREFKTPHIRESSPSVSPARSPTMQDLIKLAEDQGLDDEDFLEILTCPSPVWWEEMDLETDEDYAKGQILNENNTESETMDNIEVINNIPSQESDFNEHSLNEISEKSTEILKTNHKVQEKKSKLENILDNIRSRNKDVRDTDSHDGSTSSGKERKNSSGGLSDASINEDDLLNTLENLEIPVQKYYSDSDIDADNSRDVENVTIVMSRVSSEEIKSNSRKLKTFKDQSHDVEMEPGNAGIQKNPQIENTKHANLNKSNKVKSNKCKEMKLFNVDNINIIRKSRTRKKNNKIDVKLSDCLPKINDIAIKQEKLNMKIFDEGHANECLTVNSIRNNHNIRKQADEERRKSKRKSFLYEKLTEKDEANPNESCKIKSVRTKNNKRKRNTEDNVIVKRKSAPKKKCREIEVAPNDSLLKINDIDIASPVLLKFDDIQLLLRSNESSDAHNEVKNDFDESAVLPFEGKRKLPKSMEFLDSSRVEFDSISDSNIKYLDEYEEKRDKIQVKEENANEFVTVYRIVNNDSPNIDVEDEIKANLLCRRSKKSDSQPKVKKAKVKPKMVKVIGTDLKVPNSEARYCYKCSSVFDSETCQYCLKINKKSN